METTREKMQKKQRENQDELLEIFILIEKNNYEASKEAAIRYQRLMGVPKLSDAFTEAKARYKKFIDNL